MKFAAFYLAMIMLLIAAVIIVEAGPSLGAM